MRKNELQINYVDIIKGEYLKEQEELDQAKQKKISNLRDVYVVGLLNHNNEQRKEYFHADATKAIKIRVEDKVGLEKEEKRNKNMVENVYEIWQEKMNKQIFKMTDPKYQLIEKGEFDSANKISRIETFLKKNELIVWSSDRLMDYYLYCEKGVTEGVFIKVDVK